MSRLLADVRAFGKQYLRSRVGTFFAFIFPILLILLFGAIFTNAGSSAIGLPVQDLDNSQTSHVFLNILNQTNVVKLSTIPVDKDIPSYIKDNSLTVALQIPQGFQTMLQKGQKVNVTVYGDPSQSTVTMAQGVINAAIQHLNYIINNVQPVAGMETKPVASSTFQYMDFFLPGIVGMTVITNTVFSGTSLSAEYRSRHYFKLLATTTITKAEWIASKIIFYMLLMIVSLLAMIGVGYLVWHVQFTINLYTIGLIGVGVVLFSSIGMLLGTVVRDSESAVAIANAIVFPMMFLSGTFFPPSMMPSYLAPIANVLPLTFLNNGLRDAMVYGNLSGIITSFEVLGALAVVFFALSSKLMVWRER